MKYAFILLVFMSLAGCTSGTSKVVPYGKDTYMIAVDDIMGGSSPTRLEIVAAEKANEHCASMGKVIQVRNTSSKGNWGWSPTSSTLIFSCIDENDPENKRPILRKEPNIVIENRKE